MAVKVLGDTWNPVTGCSKISAGCRECYAERFVGWMQRLGQEKYKNGFAVTCHDDVVGDPLKRKKSKTYFVNSMSDLFHEEVPIEFIKKVFDTMNATPQHTYQILTKRSERLALLSSQLNWTENIWMGVSVERQDVVCRIDDLRNIPAGKRYIMFEPLIGPVCNIDYSGIDWAIVGGESGKNHRPMNVDWVRTIRDECVKAGVKFSFKQYSGVNPEKLGRVLDGRVWDERP